MASRSFAVLGDPVTQSLSPAIHNAAYKTLGLDWSYEAIRVESGELSSFLTTHDSYSGFSVTMPLKREAYAASIASEPAARALGVVNTLLRTPAGLLGFNTDVFGIQMAIKGVSSVESIAIVGSGATARSAIYAMQQKHPASTIRVMARNIQERDELAAEFGVHTEAIPTASIDADLVINTVPDALFETRGVTLKASYTSAEQLPENYISGTEMLIWQAIAQIRIFLKGSPELELPNEREVLEQMRLSLL